MTEEMELPQAASTPAASPIPWEDPEVPRLRGLLRTLWQVLRRPGEFFQGMPREGAGEALGFGLIVGSVGLLAYLYWLWLFCLSLSHHLGQGALFTRVVQMSAGAMITAMILTPVIVLFSLALSSLGMWAGVALLGGATGGFTPVWRINNYAQGAMVLAMVPVVGGMAAGLWILILYYQGLHRVFALSPGRAIGALLVSLMLQTIVLLFLLGGVALLGWLGLGLILG